MEGIALNHRRAVGAAAWLQPWLCKDTNILDDHPGPLGNPTILNPLVSRCVTSHKKLTNVNFELFTAVKIHSVFCRATSLPRSQKKLSLPPSGSILKNGSRSYSETRINSILKTDALFSSGTFVIRCKSTWCHNFETHSIDCGALELPIPVFEHPEAERTAGSTVSYSLISMQVCNDFDNLCQLEKHVSSGSFLLSG
jgi:hypothetical protein